MCRRRIREAETRAEEQETPEAEQETPEDVYKRQAGMISFYQIMTDTLDYRKWFEFQLFSQKSGERQKELTNSVFEMCIRDRQNKASQAMEGLLNAVHVTLRNSNSGILSFSYFRTTEQNRHSLSLIHI